MEAFGKRLKELREEKNLSQKKLGDIFNVAQRTIFAWENNKQEPGMVTIVAIADFFNVSTDFLLARE